MQERETQRMKQVGGFHCRNYADTHTEIKYQLHVHLKTFKSIKIF